MKERKGAASLYVVIFATILFGVITLSFIRIILSETTQTMNDDLSQSAYDSALSGVEDAKIAVDRYYQCLSANGKPEDCGRPSIFKANCEDDVDGVNRIGIADYLYDGYSSGEVKIQESSGASSGDYGTEQAYTCVTVTDITDDYRSTLTSDTRTRVIPIGIGSNTLSNVAKVEFSWYSETNGTVFEKLDNKGKFNGRNDSTTPPVISLSVLATGPNININDFNSDSSINFSTAVLLPTDYNAPDSIAGTKARDGSFAPSAAVTAANTLSSNDIMRNAKADSGRNDPKLTYCTHSEFACTVTLDVQGYLQSVAGGNLANINGGNLMLVASMPYGDIVTDFMVKVYDTYGNVIQFDGVQISIDSTGRANQLVRRVETRLDPADIFFPYPQYALELTGNNDDTLRKFFWITANCWTEKGYCNNNGTISD